MSGVRGARARVAVFLAAGMALAGSAASQPDDVIQAAAALGEPGVDLVFTPLTPCRIIDTGPPGERSRPEPPATSMWPVR